MHSEQPSNQYHKWNHYIISRSSSNKTAWLMWTVNQLQWNYKRASLFLSPFSNSVLHKVKWQLSTMSQSSHLWVLTPSFSHRIHVPLSWQPSAILFEVLPWPACCRALVFPLLISFNCNLMNVENCLSPLLRWNHPQ